MDIVYRSTQVGTIEFAVDANAMKPAAVKGFNIITLQIPLLFDLEAAAANRRWTLSHLKVALRAQLPNAQNWLLGSGVHVATVMPATGTLRYPGLVEIYCSPQSLAHYETVRDGTPVHLRCELSGTIYGLLRADQREYLADPEPLNGRIDFEFPRETWASMLRSCGLSASVLAEIPLPSTDRSKLNEGHRALLDAFESFERGGSTAWKDSVGHIRSYLEKWIKQHPLPPTQPPTNGSDADREWKLLSLRGALHKCCHLWVHNPKSSCTRKDALLILSTFACLLEVLP